MVLTRFSQTRIAVCAILSLAVLLIPLAFLAPAVVGSDLDRRLDGLEKDNQSIHAEHYTIMQQVTTNTKALTDLAESVKEHHDAQAGYPAFLATLDTKLDVLLGVSSTLLAGGVGWMWNRKKYSDKLVDELREHARRVATQQSTSDHSDFSNHQIVMNRLQEVETEAHAAYSEANTVNQKIARIGEDLRNHQVRGD